MSHECSRVLLAFDPAVRRTPPHLDLSSIVRVGDELWIGSDEGTSLERLSLGLGGAYDRHASFCLRDYLELPGDPDEEVDIEGLDFSDGYLWLVGSHSAVRKKPKADDPPKRRLRRLGRVETRGNRHLLARVPLVRSADGSSWEPATASPDVSVPGGERRAARLAGGRRRSELTRALRDDEHVGPFLDIPGKDNGFDIEGLAVTGPRAFIGLRGPVLRGYALLLDVEVEDDEEEPGVLRLASVGPKGRPYRKHVLDLRGLGVRELCLDGRDLYVLAGPTMQLDGRAMVLRWRGAVGADGDTVVERDELEPVLDLPYGIGEEEGTEHPEGMALTRTADGRKALLIVYDAPHANRRRGGAAVEADVFPIE